MARPRAEPAAPAATPAPAPGLFAERLFLIGLVAVPTLLVFWRAIGFPFVLWDDDIMISENESIRSLDAASLSRMFGQNFAVRYQPLALLTLAVIYKVVGLAPGAYHGVELAIHVLNAILLAFLLRRLLLLAGVPHTDRAGLLFAPTLATLIWALHPLRVEAVVWATVCGRYGQAVFFTLTSTLLYLRALAGRPDAVMRHPAYWLALAAYVGSLLTYPFCLEWPLILIVLDVYPLRRSPNRRTWIEKLPFFAAALAALTAAVFVRLTTTVATYAAPAFAQVSYGARLVRAFAVYSDALEKTLAPVGLRPVYTDLLGFVPTSAGALVSVFLVLAITGVLFHVRRRQPALLAIWLAQLILLGTKLGLLESDYMASDRYTYLQGLSWAALAAGVFVVAGRKPLGRAMRVPMFAVLCVVLGWASAGQSLIWRDSMSLFEATLPTVGDTEYRTALLGRLARARWLAGDLEGAGPLFNEAVARAPADLQLALMHAGFLMKVGSGDEAARELDRARRLTGATTREQAVEAFSRVMRVTRPSEQPPGQE